MTKITKKSVDAFAAGNRDVYLWDEELKGFGVKVTPRGRKVYLVRYRVGGRTGRTRRITLGVHGTITPDQARSQAQAALRQLARGEDPAAAKDQRKREKNVGALLEQFLSEHADARLKPRSASEYRRLVERLVPPGFLRQPISEVKRSDLAQVHNALRETPYQANRLLAVLSKFFNWCERHGFRPDHSNPARHIEKFKEEKRKRYLSAEELARLGDALRQAEQDGSLDQYGASAIRLLVLTGARLSEILTLRWSEVDFAGQCLRLEDSKTGAKSVYLNPAAVEVLTSLPRLEGNPFVICGRREGMHLVNLQKPWRRVREAAELPDVRLHDNRHSFASFAVASGMSLPLIGALLGHSQPQTTARYAHLADDPLKAAVTLVGEKLMSISKPVRGEDKA
jgi:integrase